MPLLLLLCLSLACLLAEFHSPPVEGWQLRDSIVAALAAMAAVVGLAALLVRSTARRWRRGDHDEALRRYGVWRTRHALLQMGIYILLLFVLGWGWVVHETSRLAGLNPQTTPGLELLVVLPLPLMMMISWAVFYDAERLLITQDESTATLPYGGRWRYVVFQARQNLALVLAPVVVLVLTQGVFRMFPRTFDREWTQAAATLPLAAMLVLLMPLFVRLVLPLRSLEAGPLRDRLESAAARLGCRCSDILLWNTRRGMANAMVVGLLPQLRYVLLSDRLVQEMTEDEVEAVFGHEVGHVRHWHMAYYLAFMIGSMAVLTRMGLIFERELPHWWPAANAFLTSNQDWIASWLVLPSLAVVAAYIFGVFGFLSRRCERQADIYGCRAVSCDRPDCGGHDDGVAPTPGGRGLCPTGIYIFISALRKVAWLNGISPTRPGWLHSWQHSTIARRVAFLEQVAFDPTLEQRFQHRVFLIKAALLVGVAALFLVLSVV